MTTLTPTSTPGRLRRQRELDDLIQGLDSLLNLLSPGDMIPTQKELMSQFRASERLVLKALDELQRQGKIIRRIGSGTFVAELDQVNGGVSIEIAEPVIAPSMVNANTIVAVSKPDKSYFDRAMSVLFDHIEAADLKMACRYINFDVDTIAPPPRGEAPLGFIFFHVATAHLAKQLQDAGCRVVVVGVPRADVTLDVPNVYSDQAYGGYLATKHLLELGHRRIAFCGDHGSPGSRRWRGHERALQEAQRAGLEPQNEFLFFADTLRWKDEPGLAREYFSRPGAPTAVAMWNDHQALSMVGTLSRAGIRVPEEVSIMGYDNLPDGRNLHPSLTTVDTGLDQILDAALEMVKQPPTSQVRALAITPTLVVRESTALCAQPVQGVLL